jgi:hypothetical protein
MRFRSKLLQPPSSDSEATVSKICTVYRKPGGHIEGEEDLAEILVKLGTPAKPAFKLEFAAAVRILGKLINI